MLLEVAGGAEAFQAICALVGPFSGVDTHVSCETAALGEGLVAAGVGAQVRLLPGLSDTSKKNTCVRS